MIKAIFREKARPKRLRPGLFLSSGKAIWTSMTNAKILRYIYMITFVIFKAKEKRSGENIKNKLTKTNPKRRSMHIPRLYRWHPDGRNKRFLVLAGKLWLWGVSSRPFLFLFLDDWHFNLLVHSAFKKINGHRSWFFCLQFEVDSYFTKNFYRRASVFISTLGILLGFGPSSGSDGWKKAVFGQKKAVYYYWFWCKSSLWAK